MRLKNIIIAISATMLAFTACVEESIMTPPLGTDGRPTTLSIKFAPETTITKADIAAGYAYADVEEIWVNNIALAIFNQQTGALVGFKYATFTQATDKFPTGDPQADKPYYEITDIPALTGNVYFLAIANSTGTEANLKAAAQLGQAEFERQIEEEKGTTPFTPKSLVKFGKIPYQLKADDKEVRIPLTQLAARVDINVAIENESDWDFAITGYEIKGINSKSKVFLSDYSTSSYTYNSESAIGNKNIAGEYDAAKIVRAFRFYTYERETAANPVVVKITGELVDQTVAGGTEHSTKTYEFELNPTYSNTNPNSTNGLVHGHYYDVTGKISLTTMKIEFETTVKRWDQVPVTIGAEIKEIHYLIVKETMVYMPNISQYFDEYMSDSPISILDIKATFTDYKLSGNTITKIENQPCIGDQIPTIVPVTVNGITKIHITSKLPTNFYPKDITFTVKNAAGLTEKVTVKQYPVFYMTGEVSAGGGPELAGDSPDLDSNPNIFTITIIDSGSLPNGLKVGVPTGADGQTLPTVDANNMISPRFMVASRQAVVTAGYYTSNMAIARCKTYWEVNENGTVFPAGSWRMPTLAELEFMNYIQDTSDAVKVLFNDSYAQRNNSKYWSALPAYYYDFYANVRGNVANANTAITSPGSAGGARCVRDIY